MIEFVARNQSDLSPAEAPEYPGAVYHVINRGCSRQNICVEQQDREAFPDIRCAIHDRWGIAVLAYFSMANRRFPSNDLNEAKRLNGWNMCNGARSGTSESGFVCGV